MKKLTGIILWSLTLLLIAGAAIDLERDVRDRDVFSWMDPFQYYSYALAIRGGDVPEGGFDVPTLFPYVVAAAMGRSPSIPSALRTNIGVLLLLSISVILLSRSIGTRHHPIAALAIVLFAPLLAGLSRELYIEYSLTALVAIQYVLWFQTGYFRRPLWIILYGILFTLGLLTKMTYPVFFLGPALATGVGFVWRREWRPATGIVAAHFVPLLLAAGLVWLVQEQSFFYYLSLGNTRIPIMNLIGPAGGFGWEGTLYYPIQFVRSGLGWLSLFLVLPVGMILAGSKDRSGFWSRERFTLLLWILTPLVLLTFQPVKEPRHFAPCIVPAALLIASSVAALRSRRTGIVLAALIVLFASVQYAAIRSAGRPIPYYMKGAQQVEEIERAMVTASPDKKPFVSPSGALALYPWRYTQSIALEGFSPNEALTLAWFFSPAVVYDLDTPQWEDPDQSGRPYRSFEDLFTFTSFNIYNQRSKWNSAYFTLTKEEVIRNADYVLVRRVGGQELPDGSVFSGFKEVSQISRPDGSRVSVLGSNSEERRSFRSLYAERYLERGEEKNDEVLNAVYYSLFLEERLLGRMPEQAELLNGFPEGYRPGLNRKNVFWIGNYGPIRELAGPSFERHIRG